MYKIIGYKTPNEMMNIELKFVAKKHQKSTTLR